MMDKNRFKIGIIREGKVPPDSRVPITPEQAAYIMNKYPIEIWVQPSPNRCFSNDEYENEGIHISEDLSSCDFLMGVKEVPKTDLIANKPYSFFSHTIKKQPYNKSLLQTILQKNIHLIDYEVLTNDQGKRIIAFGRFAGIVGAHNGIMTYGNRTKEFELKRMKDCKDYKEAKSIYKRLKLPAFKIAVTGGGRVASGAVEVLDEMGIQRVSPEDYLSKTYTEVVYTQLHCRHYVGPKENKPFVQEDFFANPSEYESTFSPYTKVTDLLINGIYWDKNAPAFFTKEDMQKEDFSIKVIADVTCDIAPSSSIPSTIFASTIADPIFGYDVKTGKETKPYQEGVVDMMTIDNLPNEMPRDASQAFGEMFINHVIDEILHLEDSEMITKASIAKNGALGPHFEYLTDYVAD